MGWDNWEHHVMIYEFIRMQLRIAKGNKNAQWLITNSVHYINGKGIPAYVGHLGPT